MASNLRMTLLGEIIGSTGLVQNKYSQGLNNLRAVIELEKDEVKDKLPEDIFREFENIKAKSFNLSSDLKGVPLLIIEQYYLRNHRDLSAEIYIEWKDLSLDMKIKELYLILEEFYYLIYILAVKISDYYQLEFKLKKSRDSSSEYI